MYRAGPLNQGAGTATAPSESILYVAYLINLFKKWQWRAENTWETPTAPARLLPLLVGL